jgi:hypothetical protein
MHGMHDRTHELFGRFHLPNVSTPYFHKAYFTSTMEETMGALRLWEKRLTKQLLLGGAIVTGLLIGGCGDDDDDGPLDSENQTVSEVVQNRSTLSTLEVALDSADLLTTLEGAGPFTVFAPTDAAFNALPDGRIDTLLANPQTQLTPVLQYHVVSGEVRAADLQTDTTLTTLQQSTITVTTSGDTVVLNGTARVITADITAENGVIHLIDGVLSPQ